MTSPAEILLSHAQGQLAAQAGTLDTLRNRTATVLASGGIVAGFFGISIANPPNQNLVTNLTLAAASLFGLGALLGLIVLLPVYKWDFAGKLTDQLKWAATARADQGDELALSFAEGLESQRRANKDKLAYLTWVFCAQCVFLGAQIMVEAIAKAVGT